MSHAGSAGWVSWGGIPVPALWVNQLNAKTIKRGDGLMGQTKGMADHAHGLTAMDSYPRGVKRVDTGAKHKASEGASLLRKVGQWQRVLWQRTTAQMRRNASGGRLDIGACSTADAMVRVREHQRRVLRLQMQLAKVHSALEDPCLGESSEEEAEFSAAGRTVGVNTRKKARNTGRSVSKRPRDSTVVTAHAKSSAASRHANRQGGKGRTVKQVWGGNHAAQQPMKVSEVKPAPDLELLPSQLDSAAKRKAVADEKKDSSRYCTLCQKGFSRPSSLRRHMRSHTGERPFKCDFPECTCSFAERGNLTRHYRVHSGVKPYRCRICGKRLTRRAHLLKHISIQHSNPAGLQLLEEEKAKPTGKAIAHLDANAHLYASRRRRKTASDDDSTS